MRQRFSDEQIVAILREGEGGSDSIRDVCRKHAITETTFYRWRRRFGAMSKPEVRRLRELERENERLKRMMAERDIELDIIKEFLAKNS